MTHTLNIIRPATNKTILRNQTKPQFYLLHRQYNGVVGQTHIAVMGRENYTTHQYPIKLKQVINTDPISRNNNIRTACVQIV